MPKHPWWFWFAALATAWAVDFLFWGKPAGISFVIWTGLILIAFAVLSLRERTRPAFASLVMMAFAIALALISFLRMEAFTRFINVLMALFALFLLAATYRSGNWTGFRMVDYIREGALTLWKGFARPVGLARQTTAPDPARPDESGWRAGARQAAPYLRGLLLALPVVVVLCLLLSSADLIFARQVKSFLDLFRIERWFEYLFRTIYILILGFIFSGLYLHALLPDRQQARPETNQSWIKPFLGITETTIVLAAVDLLFAFFVTIQFQYLFGGQANITETGFTYSEYARRGFGELVFVAVISLGLYLSLATVTRLDTTGKRRTFTILAALLICLVLAILASALQRLLLYEAAYGFTRLRTYTHVFILWMAVLLIAAVGLELLHRRGSFALALLLASFGFAFSLGLLNVDEYIVRQNIARVSTGEELDGTYLNSLSHDAVPELIAQFQHGGLPDEARDSLGSELACRAARARADQEHEWHWQSFNLSEYRALTLLYSNERQWRDYHVTRGVGGQQEVKLDGKIYPCYMYRALD